jgi:transposase
MVEAMFYVLRTGVAWRDLPPHFGPWQSVYTRWRRWCALGLWQEILRLVSCRAEGRVRFVDGSHIKLHQFGANPAGGQAAQAMGRTKGGLNTKICALVEGKGRLMAAVIAPGERDEVKALAPLLETLRGILLAVIRVSTVMACADRCSPKAAWPAFRPDPTGSVQPGEVGNFIDIAIRLRTFSNASKFISASPPVMRNSP